VKDADFSDAFCAFLQAMVPAVDAAELLIWLETNQHRVLEPGRIAEAAGPGLVISEAAAGKYLEQFRSRGLVTAEGAGYRFAPGGDAAGHVKTLTQAYRERPVTLIRVIYALRDTKIQTFADAFRLRGNK
jgi:hypothetical protein